MSYTCSSCRDPEFPELERLVNRLAGPGRRSATDPALVQADAIELALRSGYCGRHAEWLGELVGMAMREDAARRRALANAAVPGGR